MSGREIYRKEALDRLASPEELDCPFTLVRLRVWAVAAVAAFLGLAALAWGSFGRVPVAAEGTGVVLGGDPPGSPASPPDGPVIGRPCRKALVYFRLAEGERLREGMAARVTACGPLCEPGACLRGTVTRVSVAPVTREAAASAVGAPELFRAPDLPDRLIETEIDLGPGRGLDSCGPGPVPVRARVTVGFRTPLSLLLSAPESAAAPVER